MLMKRLLICADGDTEEMGNEEKQPVTRTISGLMANTIAQKTINFVQEQLPSWRDHPTRPYEQSENKLNLQLSKFLNDRARNDFPMVHFEHEEYQSGRTSVDVSASPVSEVTIGASLYTIYEPVVVFECKRLPAPSRSREREYVTGGTEHRNGGIQRFKLGLHGSKHDIAAMIGYIQERSAREWHEEINRWIGELSDGTIADVCVWYETEVLSTLEEDYSRSIATCQSTHKRSGCVISDNILIRHLWINMYV